MDNKTEPQVAGPGGANSAPDDGWDRGWSEHKIRQLVRLARLPFSDKLDWLEDAHKLAEAIHPSRRTTPRDIQTSPSADHDR